MSLNQVRVLRAPFIYAVQRVLINNFISCPTETGYRRMSLPVTGQDLGRTTLVL